MQATQSSRVHWLVHVAAWGVLLGQPLFFTGAQQSVSTWQEYLHALVVPLSFMVVFYVNYGLLIPRLLSARRMGGFVLANVLLIGAVMLAVHGLFHYVLPPPPGRSWRRCTPRPSCAT